MPALAWATAIPLFLMMSQTTNGASPQMLRDVEYSQAGGRSLRFDASLPAGNGLAPAAILVHGGAWVHGDRRVNVQPLFKPLSDAGIAWFSISYRLASDPLEFGIAVHDVEAAIKFIKSHAAEYRIDPDQIVLIGESAGGQLAAMAALNESPVKAVVAIYTPTDLVALARNSTLIPEGIRRQLKGSPWESLILSRLEQLSPIGKVRRGMPPFLFIHGTSDSVVPIEQSRTMCDRMKEVGADCRLITVAGAGHGIRWWESSPTTSDYYKREMIAWIRMQLAHGSVIAL